MRDSSSIDSGLLWTAIGGMALGLGAALLAMTLLSRSEPARAEASVAFERPKASIMTLGDAPAYFTASADLHTPAAPPPPGSTSASSSSALREVSIGVGAGVPTTEKVACPGDERSFLRLIEDAQVRPTYQQRSVLGVQLFGIKPESFWETLGIRTGDLVVEINHEQVDSREASIDLLRYVGNASSVILRVHALSGQDRQILWEAPPSADPATLPEHCRS